jgi:Mn-dependent DtxR family transcriptional regulator
MTAKTTEERFLFRLYEMAIKAGDPYHPVNRYDVGNSLGLTSRVVDPMCKMFLRVNFIKKISETDISLTPHGEVLAKSFLKQDTQDLQDT